MLWHRRRAFPGDYTARDFEFEPVLPDFRFCEFGTDGGFNLLVVHVNAGLSMDGGRAWRGSGDGRTAEADKQDRQRKQSNELLHELLVHAQAYNSHMPLDDTESNSSRREFLRKTVNNAGRAASVGAIAMTAASYSRVMGANDRINMGLIGAGDRGQHVMGEFQHRTEVHVAAVCDAYGQRVDSARQKFQGAVGFADYRKLLDSTPLDAVLIATPDHWHTRIAVEALNAGKDVYVEKPLSRTIDEGPPVVKAARENNRVCQVGMQQRSGRHYLEAKEKYFDTNKLGAITLARTWWYGNSWHLRKAPASLKSQPADLDWSQFVGPIKWRDYDPQQFYNWRAYLDFWRWPSDGSFYALD